MPPSPLAVRDASDLRLLAGLYQGLGTFLGVTAVGVGIAIGCMGQAFRSMLSLHPDAGANAENILPPRADAMFVLDGVLVSVILLVPAVLLFFTGRCLVRQRYRGFCLVMACLACTMVPLGTALGIFTIFVLGRPGIIAMFQRESIAMLFNRS